MQKDQKLVTPVEFPLPSKMDVEIDKWFHESFNSTALGHHTPIWNLVLAAKEDLKQRLAALNSGS